MEWTLRELRVFVSAAEAGSFTAAARELHLSQAAVSRTVASLEKCVGADLLRRVPRGCELTSAGRQALPEARRVLAEADRFDQSLRARQQVLRLGYAWAALGTHTPGLQRSWAIEHDKISLHLARHNTPSSGLAEGLCDVAIVRRPIDENRFASVVVGLERRFAAFSSEDPEWGRRRNLRMSEIAERTVIIDYKAGSTGEELWHGAARVPTFIESSDVDGWLDSIVAGQGVGTTAEATVHHHPRPGVSYRPIKDGPLIPVRLAWWRGSSPAGLTGLIESVTRLYGDPGSGAGGS